jgi:GNAT superfamily N-acetyltransferase
MSPVSVTLGDGRTVSLRPAGARDAQEVQAFVRRLSWQARLERFFIPVAELTPRQLERMVASPGLAVLARDARGRCVAHAQYALAEGEAEFAVVVADDWQGAGLGERLVSVLIEQAWLAGVRGLSGVTRLQNAAMQHLASKLGFSFLRDADPGLVRLRMAFV